MLRIKYNVDLKELEKFGFEKYGDSYAQEVDAYCLMIIDGSSRRIEVDFEVGYYGIDLYNNILFNLIQAGFVEKVED